MRVLLITKCYPPYSGGAAVNYKIFLDELSKMKKISKVNILTNYNKDCNVIENSINNNTNVIRILLDYQSYSNIIIKFLAFSIQVLQSLVIGLLIRLFKYYDLIQIHSDFLWASNGKILNPGVLFLSKSANKTVLDIRDKTSIPKMDYGYSHYFANSNYIFKKLKNNLRELKCSLIYSPIDFYEKDDLIVENIFLKEKPYICFIGKISHNKGVFKLFEAMEILLSQVNFSHKLLLCGNIVDRMPKIPNNCKYIGPLDNLNAMKLLYGSSLLVLPSKSESLPRVVMEAIVYKIPFLMTGGVSEIEDNFPKNILLNNNPESIALGITEILKRKKKYLKNSYPMQLHDTKKVIEQIYYVYYELLYHD